MEIVKYISEIVTIPVIASRGAGKVEHFSEVFEKTRAEAGLAAGIFHREEVPIEAVEENLKEKGMETRQMHNPHPLLCYFDFSISNLLKTPFYLWMFSM